MPSCFAISARHCSAISRLACFSVISILTASSLSFAFSNRSASALYFAMYSVWWSATRAFSLMHCCISPATTFISSCSPVFSFSSAAVAKTVSLMASKPATASSFSVQRMFAAFRNSSFIFSSSRWGVAHFPHHRIYGCTTIPLCGTCHWSATPLNRTSPRSPRILSCWRRCSHSYAGSSPDAGRPSVSAPHRIRKAL